MKKQEAKHQLTIYCEINKLMFINELKLAKELIRRPSVTPIDAGAINICLLYTSDAADE